MQNFVVALLSLSIAVGCTTTRSYESISASSAAQIEPGRTAVIEFVDGTSEEVEVRSYGDSSLEVVSADNTVRHIDYADVQAVRTQELSGLKTAGLVTLALLAFGVASALDDIAFFPSAP